VPLPSPTPAADCIDTGTGPFTVVLLHSSMSSKSQWRGLADALRCTARVIAPDLLGYGAAPMPADGAAFTLDHEVERLLALLQQRGVQGPLHLVGHSYGGAVALRLAPALGRRLQGLTLYEPTAFHAVPAPHARQLDEVRAVAAALQLAGDGVQAAAAVERFIDFWNEPGSYAALPPARQAGFVALAPKVRLDFRRCSTRASPAPTIAGWRRRCTWWVAATAQTAHAPCWPRCRRCCRAVSW
jgi:pimeloyl-ACP methyl ester carboxylesterase